MSADSAALAPLVSCLMVTANRRRLCRRAVRCFLSQTYPSAELIVVDDGEEPLDEALQDVPPERLQYIRLPRTPRQVLGALRNVALEAARGEYVAQWDDDDWYHPERLERQTAPLRAGAAEACVLSGALMHLDVPPYTRHAYVGPLSGGVPGTIVHRRNDALRYPTLRKAEDTLYLQQFPPAAVARLPKALSYLFIRSFHGSNTWDVSHFERRLRNGPGALAAYVWSRHVRRDVRTHPRFRLSAEAQAAFAAYLRDSQELGLLLGGA